jgi:MFS family permease
MRPAHTADFAQALYDEVVSFHSLDCTFESGLLLVQRHFGGKGILLTPRSSKSVLKGAYFLLILCICGEMNGGWRTWLGLERNIVVMLAALLVLGMGEELWTRFVPKYLELLGAGTWVIAAYGTLKDLLEAVYPYPGGWVVDHAGRKKALLLFTLVSMAGYVVYLISASPVGILAGTVLVMAWSSLTLPAIFAIIADHLPLARRSIGFGVQSFLKRVPIIIAPVIGGWLIAQLGFSAGIRIGFGITITFAVGALWIITCHFKEKPERDVEAAGIGKIWREMDGYLKRLLLADILARWAEGIPKVFVILYLMNVLRVSPVEFGWLTSLQMFVAMALYIPIAKISEGLNRKPFVLLTFIFFALFPLVLVNATGIAWVIVAFAFAGLREVGEPARKALIVDLAKGSSVGRGVGLYYMVRGLSVFPAALVGGWLWTIAPEIPFYAAFAIGALGCVFYAIWGPDDRKS